MCAKYLENNEPGQSEGLGRGFTALILIWRNGVGAPTIAACGCVVTMPCQQESRLSILDTMDVSIRHKED